MARSGKLWSLCCQQQGTALWHNPGKGTRKHSQSWRRRPQGLQLHLIIESPALAYLCASCSPDGWLMASPSNIACLLSGGSCSTLKEAQGWPFTANQACWCHAAHCIQKSLPSLGAGRVSCCLRLKQSPYRSMSFVPGWQGSEGCAALIYLACSCQPAVVTGV